MVLAIAQRVFDIEIESLRQVAAALDDQFEKVIEVILSKKGKVILSGIGKSGLVAQKISATLTSTGTPSFFLHPSEAFHGDLGIVDKEDTVILISYSGETDEILKIVPFLIWNGNVVIAMTGNLHSTLAKNANHCLRITVPQEACPLQLAPTSSTTATLVMGDALAITLMELRNFQTEDFARFHPGGNLGRKLLVCLKDVMRKDALPFIDPQSSFTQLVLSMSEGRLGMVILGKPEKIEGVITDGDLRRALVKFSDIQKVPIKDFSNPAPVVLDENEHLFKAEQLMLEKKITTLLIRNQQGIIKGVYQIFNK